MLFIGQSVLSKIIVDVESHETEYCGFLFGYEENEQRTITKSMSVHNSKEGDQRTRYEIKSIDYLQAEMISMNENLSLVGVYHSHPNHLAIPSECDRMAAQPYFSYIIISIINKKFAEVRSWQLNSQYQFEEEKIFQLAK